MNNIPNCLKCNSEYTYEDGAYYICPECAHEWAKNDMPKDDINVIKDSNGNILQNGDTVMVVRDLKVKGGYPSIKIGTKVKNIRLVEDSGDGHNIECKIDGYGAMKLKSEVVKRA